jgi:dipeptidyl-peptidase-4
MKKLILIASLALSGLLATGNDSQAADPATRIYRDKVSPHWFAGTGGSDKFWYRLELPGKQKEFILVDAEKGERAPAFDHVRLAAALAALLGKPVDAKALPVDSLTFSPDTKKVTLHSQERSWELDLENYTVTPAKKADGKGIYLRPQRMPHPSRTGEEDTAIKFINRLPEEVNLFWVKPDGVREPYGSVAPNEEREQHTFSGHAWLVTGKNGAPLATFDAQDEPGIALIEPRMQFDQPPSDNGDKKPNPRVEGPRSPDRKWEIAVRGDNLFLRDAKSGKEQQLTFDANADSSYARNAEAARGIEMEYGTRDSEQPTPEVYWAPDSRHFVAMRHTRGSQRRVSIVESSPKDQLQPRLVSLPYLKPGDDVPYGKPHLFDAGAKKEIPVEDSAFANPWSIDGLRWNPDSSEFTFLFNQRGHQALRILGVDARSGAVRTLVDETSKTFVCYSAKFFSESLNETGEIIWMSERDGWNHLYLYDAKTGRVKNQITKGEWVVRAVDRVDREKRQLWFQAGGMNPGEDPYYIQYYRVNFDGTGLTALTSGEGTHSVQYSPDKRFLIDTWSRVNQPPVNELRCTEDGKLLCRLEEADASELLTSGWTAPEPFVAKGRDGATDIYGVIFRPGNFDPKKSYPVIEDIYAGPQDSFAPKEFRANRRFQDLLNRGCIIVQIDGMGTSNRSKAFHDVCWKNLADSGFPDRILWIKAAAAKYPCMDLTRVGIFGGSAGGQSALRGLLDHGDFYKAGVADSGCHDNRMDKIWWNEQWMGWPMDESYVRSSNVVDAHKLQGKLLLMVGEMDTNVDPASTMQVVNALIKAGKDFEFLDVPGAGHGIIATPYGRQRLTEFFTRTLLETSKK